uniref:Uncharacterized protein n=1 Tax=Mus spicilegus TaxID=10103 RepID=A0A8C6GHC9_MUSSI
PGSLRPQPQLGAGPQPPASPPAGLSACPPRPRGGVGGLEIVPGTPRTPRLREVWGLGIAAVAPAIKYTNSVCPLGMERRYIDLDDRKPQYPEFFQEKEDGKDSEGESRRLTLGCLSVWKRPVLPDWLHVPQGQASAGMGT